MTSTATPGARVVVAGGGVGAVEAVLALRALAGDGVDLELVAPDAELVHRPVAVAEPFGGAPAQRLPLARLQTTHGVPHRRDRVTAVDSERRRVRLDSGGELPYDLLVVGTGARAEPWLTGALTFAGSPDVAAYRDLLAALESGAVAHVLFAAPPRTAWTLPLYELALLTTTWLVDRDVIGARLTLATPDREPLAAFGAAASAAVRDLLSDRGIELVTGCEVHPDPHGRVDLERLGRIRPDRIVTLPRLVGRPLPGLPADVDGFVPVDEHAAVVGVTDVYAVGDMTDSPVKHGSLAAQQADVAAAAIAAQVGASVRPESFTPVLRGVLLTGVTSAYLRAGAAAGERVGFALSWSADLKTAARHLSAYLAGQDRQDDDAELRRQALEFAHADARWGDLRSALQWLAVVERLEGGELGGALGEQRDRWKRELAARETQDAPGAPALTGDWDG